ncbi:e3 ubiquitin ligase ARI10 [Fusarium sp. NRRL 25303]|nr:e3 ubiquitin ligase ARI10 [Fusarium sp. NRRL 25303]
MDTRQDYDENTSSEVAPSVIAVAQNEETPGQQLGEEPDTQDDSSHDEADLDDEMDVDDEGSEYMGDTLDGLSDGESNYQPGEDSEEHQPNGESEGEDNTSDDEMTVDDEVDENPEDMLEPLSDDPSDDEHSEATSQQGQQRAVSEEESAETEMQHCDICGELRPIMAFQPLLCGDEYCNLCIIETVKVSLSSTLHFPVKCCNEEIPPKVIEEHKTTDRTYCSNRQCLEFIPPNNTSDDGEPCYGDEAKCPACNDITCTICKNKAHAGDCEKQNEWEKSLELAEGEGWKRCSRCGHLIERSDGCPLMTCPCGHEFCYSCGKGSETCDC